MVEHVLHDVVAQLLLGLPLLLVSFDEAWKVFIGVVRLVARILVFQPQDATCIVQLIFDLIFI